MKTSKRKRSPKSAPVVEALDVASAPAVAESAAPVVAVEVAEPANEPVVADAAVANTNVAAESIESDLPATPAVASEAVATQTGDAEAVVTEVVATETGDAEAVVTEVVATETGDAEAVVAEVVATQTGDAEAVVTEVVATQTGDAEAVVIEAVAFEAVVSGAVVIEAVAEVGVVELGPDDETVAVETVVADQPAVAASVEPVVVLAANCSVKDAAALKTSLCAVANENSAVTLDASAVERVDTATMQLLCAFVRDRSARNQSIVWRGQSQALHDAVRLLGVGALLGFEGAAA